MYVITEWEAQEAGFSDFNFRKNDNNADDDDVIRGEVKESSPQREI